MPTGFYDLVGKIGFGHFLRNCNIVVNSYHLDDLVGRYIGNFEFKLKDKVVKFTVEGVSQILVIPSVGLPINITRDDDCTHETVFWQKYFGVTQVSKLFFYDILFSGKIYLSMFKYVVSKLRINPLLFQYLC